MAEGVVSQGVILEIVLRFVMSDVQVLEEMARTWVSEYATTASLRFRDYDNIDVPIMHNMYCQVLLSAQDGYCLFDGATRGHSDIVFSVSIVLHGLRVAWCCCSRLVQMVEACVVPSQEEMDAAARLVIFGNDEYVPDVPF